MTYDATVQFKFDATYTHDYNRGFGSTVVDDFIPEEHYLITAPAADLNSTQYFKLFEKFLLCVGMCPSSIRSGAMSLVFNDYVLEEEQRKVCKEYEITMDEDLEKKYVNNLGRYSIFTQYTDDQLQEMIDMYEQSKLNGVA